jgi:hypothetical protein
VHLLRGQIARAAWGPTLLAGHMECFEAACAAVPDFEWFITTASNSLFFRRFDPVLTVKVAEAVVRSDKPAVEWDDLPDTWHWPKMRKQAAVGVILQDRWKVRGLSGGQIEGRTAKRRDWDLLNRVQADLFGDWASLEAPLQEILPVTVFNALGSGLSCSICRVHFGRADAQGGRFSQFADLIDPSNLPPHVCMMKWFQRDPLCPETLAVCTPLGREVLAALQAAAQSPGQRMEIEMLLRGALSGLEQQQIPTPIPLAGQPGAPATFTLDPVVANRRICAFDGGPALPGQNYLYFEKTGATLALELAAVSENTLNLRCALIAPPPEQAALPVTDPALQCYAYLVLPADRPLRIRLQGAVSGGAAARILSRITWHQGGRYTIQRPLLQTLIAPHFTVDFLFPQGTGPSHIGLPIYAGHDMGVSLSEIV